MIRVRALKVVVALYRLIHNVNDALMPPHPIQIHGRLEYSAVTGKTIVSLHRDDRSNQRNEQEQETSNNQNTPRRPREGSDTGLP
jgi:hypothetical protein